MYLVNKDAAAARGRWDPKQPKFSDLFFAVMAFVAGRIEDGEIELAKSIVSDWHDALEHGNKLNTRFVCLKTEKELRAWLEEHAAGECPGSPHTTDRETYDGWSKRVSVARSLVNLADALQFAASGPAWRSCWCGRYTVSPDYYPDGWSRMGPAGWLCPTHTVKPRPMSAEDKKRASEISALLFGTPAPASKKGRRR